jgi:hypothetical protein
MLLCQFTSRNGINAIDVLQISAADGGGFTDEFRLHSEKPLPPDSKTYKTDDDHK